MLGQTCLGINKLLRESYKYKRRNKRDKCFDEANKQMLQCMKVAHEVEKSRDESRKIKS